MLFDIRLQALWAKKAEDGKMLWLPLTVHMADTAGVMRKIWNEWLAEGVKQLISSYITGGDAEKFVIFLAVAHDIAKATPVFQAKTSKNHDLDERILEGLADAGLPMEPFTRFAHPQNVPHALATQILLQKAGCNRQAAVILGAHHGKPPSTGFPETCGPEEYPLHYHLGTEGRAAWQAVQQELLDYALGIAGYFSLNEVPAPNMAAQVLLTGLVIMADWIASDEKCFPFIRLESTTPRDLQARVDRGWEALGLPSVWVPGTQYEFPGFCQARFGFAPNAVQSTVEQTAIGIRSPGILILEAPMGAGKTEAALLATETFAAKAQRKGIFFALPTQATSNAMFSRVQDFISRLGANVDLSTRLVHGKAQLNAEFQRLASGSGIGEDEETGVFVHEWFEGRKKSMLDDFVVGTIDQLLFAALKQKHVMLRHLGLANKVVIIDELHSFDAYMNQYLYRALNWLGVYHVPVIVLSATLPAQTRQNVIDAYIEGRTGKRHTSETAGNACGRADWRISHDYPLITYTDDVEVRQKTIPPGGRSLDVALDALADDALEDTLNALLAGGGCAGVIVNTVNRAQELAKRLRARFGDGTVGLFHSRFLAVDRAAKEEALLHALGKPGRDVERPSKYIVVGTQVLEQSLDLDLDLLVTDLCPMDLLLQRIGRLHRHDRARPSKLRQALCLIMGLDGDGFEAGTETIYGRYLLMRTKTLLPKHLSLPRDIPGLVQTVYDDSPLPDSAAYQTAKQEYEKRINGKEERAGAFRLSQPQPGRRQTLVGWLDTAASEHAGEAAVRDTDDSLEVIVIRRGRDGALCFLPWIRDGEALSPYEMPDDERAKALACCTVYLPRALSGPWVIGKTIEVLEESSRQNCAAWLQSPWLHGALFLILDETLSAALCGQRLTYLQEDGLLYQKEEDHTDA